MTPTRDQLDHALPRVQAGIGAMAGDLVDPDERSAALDWLEKLIGEAVAVCVDPSDPEHDGRHCRNYRAGGHRCCWCGQRPIESQRRDSAPESPESDGDDER